MEIEKQVVSFELAIRLNELNVQQDSLFYWGVGFNGSYLLFNDYKYDSISLPISAFTATELLEMLPCTFGLSKDARLMIDRNYHGKYCVQYKDSIYYFQSMSLTDALAEMLIFHVEKGIINIA